VEAVAHRRDRPPRAVVADRADVADLDRELERDDWTHAEVSVDLCDETSDVCHRSLGSIKQHFWLLTYL